MSIGINRVYEPWIHIPIYLGVAISVLIMAWWQRQEGWRPDCTVVTKKAKILSFVRAIYPVLLFGYFFTSGHAFNRIIFSNWLDPWFMNIDNSIFGYLPSLEWGKSYPNVVLQELFHGAYFCYYPMILCLPVYLYFKQPKAFKELIFNLTFVFYLCYTIYSVIPVIGGRYIPAAMEITQTYRAGLFTHIMVFIYRSSHHLGGAFPSSHIAITLVLTVAALRFVRPVGIVFTIIAFFLSVATVYCHYHWFIDAICGILTGIAGYYLANYVRSKLATAGFE
jgi:membrane-associated phospholipid phosphatase